MAIIAYTSGVDATDPSFAYQASSYAFDAEDDAQFISINSYFESAANTDVQVIGGFCVEADDATFVQYHERDDQPFFAPYLHMVVTESDEYYNGDGDDDGVFVSRGNSDMAQCDLGVPHYLLTGSTLNAASAALAGTTVDVFKTSTNGLVAAVTSNGSGVYNANLYEAGPYYCVAYLAGSPDVAGTTVNTLIAAGQ